MIFHQRRWNLAILAHLGEPMRELLLGVHSPRLYIIRLFDDEERYRHTACRPATILRLKSRSYYNKDQSKGDGQQNPPATGRTLRFLAAEATVLSGPAIC